ncbi:unnamed protein product [Meloidogyne enterolobii]|uniref:Uncharacterized protein n=1 Tax=Meloidogyne enterolobii TaxID=390850 RepID=A0ACB0Y9P0_MELEN
MSSGDEPVLFERIPHEQTTTSSTALISQQPTTSANAIIQPMPTTSANDFSQATTSPNIEYNTQQRSADLPNYFLDNVLGDGDCLFRFID